MAAILYNIGSLHSKLGAEEARTNPESMKVALTHYQCAAWAYGQLKDAFTLVLKGDLSPELLIFMQQISFAQAQECILEKSLTDNRKPGIIAKVTSQVINYYNAAMSALFHQSEDCNIQELVGNKLYKEWLKYIKFKISYFSAVLLLYQGLNAEELKKMGQRITLFNAAVEKFEEAKKESKGLANQELIQEVLTQTNDVLVGKQKNAKSENDFIYHEEVPDISTISAVQGVNLVSGVGFDVSDAEILGEDIFKRLIPMKTHEASSLYSEEKAMILRSFGAKIEDKDVELNSYMSSLNMDSLNSLNQMGMERLPLGIVDRCAELSAKPDAIPNLVQSMSNLAEACADVETMLNEIRQMLDEENKREKEYQKQLGPRPQGGHLSELNREFNKYLEAHNKAGESNDTLRKAMELHVNNLKILSRPLVELQEKVPRLSEPIEEATVKDLKLLLSKVQEMKDQRAQLFNNLRETVNGDDITSQLVAHGDKNSQELFKRELKKYSTMTALIDQNLEAQGNILKALTDTYAKYAPLLKQINDVRLKKEQFYSSMQASFDVYEDLLQKSSKGLEFYKKLQGNVQKLVSRVKGARDVQDEERQQMLKTIAPPKLPVVAPQIPQAHQMPQNVSSGPKLKDYLKSGMFPNLKTGVEEKSGLPERPTPLGQENVATTCALPLNPPGTAAGQYYNAGSYYPNAMGTVGYTNPIYQNPYYSSSHMNQQKKETPQYPAQQPSPALSQSSDSSGKTYGYQHPQQATPPLQQHSYNPSQTQQGYPGNWAASSAATTGNNMRAYNYFSVTSPTQQTPSYSFGTQPGTMMTSNQNPGQYQYQNPQLAQNAGGNVGKSYQNQGQVQYPGNYQQQQKVSQYNQSYTSQGPATTPQSQVQGQNQMVSSNFQNPEVVPQNQTQQFSANFQNSQNYSTNSQNQQIPAANYSNPMMSGQQTSANQYSQYSNLQSPQSSGTSLQNSQNLSTNPQNPQQYSTNSQISQNFSANPQQFSANPQNSSANLQNSRNFPANPQNSQVSASNFQYPQNYATNPQYSSVNPQNLQNSQVTTSNFQNPQNYSMNPQNPQIPQQNSQYSSASLQNPQVPQQNLHNFSQQQENQFSQPAPSSQNYQNPVHNPQNLVQNQFTSQNYSNQTVPASQTPNNFYQQQNYQYGQMQGQYKPTSSNQNNVNTPTVNSITSYSNAYNSQSGATNVTNSSYSSTGIQTEQSQQAMTQTQGQYQPQQPMNYQNLSDCKDNTRATPTLTNHAPNNKTYPTQSQTKQITSPVETPKKVYRSENMDLLSEIDFTVASPSIETVPTLQPQTVKPESLLTKMDEDVLSEILSPKLVHVQVEVAATDRKSSLDNLSMCSDISSIDQNFDWESVSIKQDSPMKTASDPFDNANVLKLFHKEVERLEKFYESLTIKTLSGVTPLDNKWKELQDLLVSFVFRDHVSLFFLQIFLPFHIFKLQVKDEANRSVSVAKLFPDKNRSIDCLPYDHARVLLPTTTDNYINAVSVKVSIRKFPRANLLASLSSVKFTQNL